MTHPTRQRSTARFASALLLAAAPFCAAQPDDTAGSNMVIGFDTPTKFGAEGAFQSNDKDGIDGINNDPSLPTLALPIRGRHWQFDIMHYVMGWNADGARAAQIGIVGDHLVGPHADDAPTNHLPEIWCRSVAIPWDRTRLLAVSATIDHPAAGHKDFYGISSLTHAVEADPGNNIHRHLRGDDPRLPVIVLAKHGEPEHEFWPNFNTRGSSPVKGTGCSFDPDRATLSIVIGETDILDRDGGRTRGVDPIYANDPALFAQTEIVELRLVGFDDTTGEYLFDGGRYLSVNDEEGLHIEGTLEDFRIRSSLTGETMGASGAFAQLSVADGVNDDSDRPRWSQQFVETGWFGRELSEQQADTIVYPVLTFSTDIDIVEATDGFTREAVLPATVLLTIATDPSAPCPADFNNDAEVNTIDVLAFLNAWSAGDMAADFNADGVVNTLDVLAFLNAWSNGCD